MSEVLVSVSTYLRHPVLSAIDCNMGECGE